MSGGPLSEQSRPCLATSLTGAAMQSSCPNSSPQFSRLHIGVALFPRHASRRSQAHRASDYTPQALPSRKRSSRVLDERARRRFLLSGTVPARRVRLVSCTPCEDRRLIEPATTRPKPCLAGNEVVACSTSARGAGSALWHWVLVSIWASGYIRPTHRWRRLARIGAASTDS
jgi:hypothetical protein